MYLDFEMAGVWAKLTKYESVPRWTWWHRSWTGCRTIQGRKEEAAQLRQGEPVNLQRPNVVSGAKIPSEKGRETKHSRWGETASTENRRD